MKLTHYKWAFLPNRFKSAHKLTFIFLNTNIKELKENTEYWKALVVAKVTSNLLGQSLQMIPQWTEGILALQRKDIPLLSILPWYKSINV